MHLYIFNYVYIIVTCLIGFKYMYVCVNTVPCWMTAFDNILHMRIHEWVAYYQPCSYRISEITPAT